jgi:hypothetical protein
MLSVVSSHKSMKKFEVILTPASWEEAPFHSSGTANPAVPARKILARRI